MTLKCEPSSPVSIFRYGTDKPAMQRIRCPNCDEWMIAAKADGKWYYFHKFIYGKDGGNPPNQPLQRTPEQSLELCTCGKSEAICQRHGEDPEY